MTLAGGLRPTLREQVGPFASRPGRTGWSGLLAVAVPTTMCAAHGMLYGRWLIDDAAITWAYARALAAGAGPALQPGGSVAEGWSNPTWLAVWVVVSWLGLPVLAAAKALAVACCAVMFAGMLAGARAILPARADLAAGLAGVLVACVPSFTAWAVSGLENPLYAAVVVWLAAVTARGPLSSPRVAAVAGALAAAAALTRPDGLVYLAVFPLLALAAERRRGLRSAVVAVAVAVVPVAAYVCCRWSRFGLLVPNTAVAKAQGAPTAAPLLELAPAGGVLLAAAAFTGALAAATNPAARRGLAAVAGTLLLAVGAYAALAQDWMGLYRFATPVWPLAALLLAAGVLAARARPRVLAAVAGMLAVAVSLPGWASAGATFRASPTVPVCLVAQIDGREPNRFADLLGLRDTTLLVPDVGGAALVARPRIVDLAGLADQDIARYWSTVDMTGLRDHVFTTIRPTMISAHGGWASASGLFTDPRLPASYEQISEGAGGAQLWIRRDVLAPGAIERLRADRTAVGGPAEAQVRAAPRASCPLDSDH